MTNYIEAFEREQIARIAEGKVIPKFRAGDIVRVHVRIQGDAEGKGSRVQMYEGLCIARRNRPTGYNSSITVRKISGGEGVERVFFLYSPLTEKIEVVRRGVVRRAKLYYMRQRTGRSARIREKMFFAEKRDDSESSGQNNSGAKA